jgi:Transposase.
LRVKGLHQQDIQSLLRARELLIKERTALINQTRGFLAEYGVIVAKGLAQLQQALPTLLEDAENGLTAACYSTGTKNGYNSSRRASTVAR